MFNKTINALLKISCQIFAEKILNTFTSMYEIIRRLFNDYISMRNIWKSQCIKSGLLGGYFYTSHFVYENIPWSAGATLVKRSCGYVRVQDIWILPSTPHQKISNFWYCNSFFVIYFFQCLVIPYFGKQGIVLGKNYELLDITQATTRRLQEDSLIMFSPQTPCFVEHGLRK